MIAGSSESCCVCVCARHTNVCMYGWRWRQIYDVNRQLPWERRADKLVWRGSTTGGTYTKDNWRTFPRGQLVCLLLHSGVHSLCWLVGGCA